MKAVLFSLKSRVAKHFGLISMHNAKMQPVLQLLGYFSPVFR